MTELLTLRIPLLASLFLAVPLPSSAEELRITSDSDWRQWELRGDATELSGGVIGPSFVRRDIDAVDNATDFGGGIRDVGTNRARAGALIDGDQQTSWSPNEGDPLDTWWVELDLGRVVSARTIQLSFADDSAPLEFFNILTSDGEPLFDRQGVVIQGTLRYQGLHRYTFNEQHQVEIDFGLKPLHYIRIEAKRKQEAVRLSGLSVDTVGDNISMGLRGRGGDIEIIVGLGEPSMERRETLGLSNTIIDGDLTTNWRFSTYEGSSAASADVPPQEIFGRITLDMGVLYWIDRVRILGDLSGMTPSSPSSRGRASGRNFLWYKLSGSDGSLAPNGTLKWTTLGERPPDIKNFLGTFRFEERFELQRLRHFRLLFPLTLEGQQVSGDVGTTAEFQTFGEGFPAEVILQSPLYDFGAPRNVNTVEWIDDTPPGTRMELRSRTGNLLEEIYVHHDKDGAVVTEERYNKLIKSFRGVIDTVKSPGADWSTWSRFYEQSGDPFQSPSPRQYVQLEARLLSDDPMVATSIDQIVLTHSSPLADKTSAEVYPTDARPGELQDFTYFLKTTFASGNRGFDRVILTSEGEIEYVAIRLDGAPTEAQIEQLEEGIEIRLDSPVNRSRLLEVDFRSRVFLNQTRFDAVLVNGSGTAALRQPVDAGDAKPDIDSEVTFVSLPTRHPLVGDVTLSSSVITPNGDGVGDELTISFSLFQLLVARPVDISIHTLSGRRVRLLSDEGMTAGPVSIEWDGRDDDDRIVAPGTYVLRVESRGDARSETLSRVVSVAY